MENLKVGDIVMINPASCYYDDSYNNPREGVGEVIRVSDIEDWYLPIYVEWQEGETNVYATKDLIKVGELA